MAPSDSNSLRMRFSAMRPLPLTCRDRARSRLVPLALAASALSTASRVSAGVFAFLGMVPVYTSRWWLRHRPLFVLLRMRPLGVLLDQEGAQAFRIVGTDVVNAPGAVFLHQIEHGVARLVLRHANIAQG